MYIIFYLGNSYSTHQLSDGRYPIIVSRINCRGTENKLSECPFVYDIRDHDCLFNAVNVTCAGE